MIVERYTFKIKNGKWDDALELFKEGRKNIWPFFSCRIYSCNYGPFNTFVIDNEFKDRAEMDKLWEKLVAKEEWPQFIDKMNELTTEEGTHTLWTLE